jgi:hypothetical protein
MPILPALDQQLRTIREASPRNVALVHVDTCLPCYLNDHHNRDGECLFGIYVDGTTTNGEARGLLLDEFRQTDDRVPDEIAGEFVAALDRLFADLDADKLFDASLEVPEPDHDIDGGEACQAWFVLTWETPIADD